MIACISGIVSEKNLNNVVVDVGGEVYESGGDILCTGGSSADTCCALP
jgi:Holliday junction resolvasome RuvABC DNA-binding subunit